MGSGIAINESNTVDYFPHFSIGHLIFVMYCPTIIYVIIDLFLDL